MSLFRARIRLEGPLASPLASGMIFGQLCWTLRELKGEAVLIDWLGRPEALWAVSDAFPADWLPRPLLAPRVVAPETNAGDYADRKRLRKHTLISRAGFLRHRRALRDSDLGADILGSPADETHRLARNSIDRHTGRALDSGGLYFRAEVWPRDAGPAAKGDGMVGGPDRDIYVDAPNVDGARLHDVLTHLGEAGFGKSASLGRGRFTVKDVAPDPELETLPGADRLVSLSRGDRTANMADVWCRIEPHFGKAGPRVTLGEGASPFKRPILLTRPGATFARGGEGRFGSWLGSVHPTRPEIGHNALHVAIPFREAAHADV
jgi:CRISPR-associated protein Csm4